MKIDVKKIAKLASIPLKEEDEEKFAKQLEDTLTHVARLTDIDTSTVVGTNEVTNLKNVFREDIVLPSLSQEQALKNAKKTYNGFFVVPALLSE